MENGKFVGCDHSKPDLDNESHGSKTLVKKALVKKVPVKCTFGLYLDPKTYEEGCCGIDLVS